MTKDDFFQTKSLIYLLEKRW